MKDDRVTFNNTFSSVFFFHSLLVKMPRNYQRKVGARSYRNYSDEARPEENEGFLVIPSEISLKMKVFRSKTSRILEKTLKNSTWLPNAVTIVLGRENPSVQSYST